MGADALARLITDLEQQAEGLHLDARMDTVAALGEAEYAQLGLASRLAGSVGSAVRVHTRGGLVVVGDLLRCAPEWMVLAAEDREWLVPLTGVMLVGGLTGHATAEEARTVVGRLSLASVLRGLARDHARCLLHLADGRRLECRIRRVGADFVEVDSDGVLPAGLVVAFAALAAVQGER